MNSQFLDKSVRSFRQAAREVARAHIENGNMDAARRIMEMLHRELDAQGKDADRRVKEAGG